MRTIPNQPHPDLDLVREAWVLGFSINDIAAKFGVSEHAALKLVHERLGYAQQYRFDDDTYAEWKSLYENERWTYREIAEAHECGVGSVRYHLARVGAKLRRRGWSAKRDAQWQRLHGQQQQHNKRKTG